jgi:SAM-dependent methyltransferase
MAGRIEAAADRLPSPLSGWLERSRRYYRGIRNGARRAPEPSEVDAAGMPLPPAALRRLVTASDDPDWWVLSGCQDAQLIGELVERNGAPMADMAAILDFGCGSGRVTRWWADLHGPRVFGCDYDDRLAVWCQRNLPFATVKTNPSVPPLPFGDATFDLVYALSLFTHLAEDAQERWMRDVLRVLRPGGLLLFTAHGERYLRHLDDEQRAAFRGGAHVILAPELSGMEGCAAFHPPAYVRDRLLPHVGLELVDAVLEPRREELLGSPMARQDNYLARKPGMPD